MPRPRQRAVQAVMRASPCAHLLPLALVEEVPHRAVDDPGRIVLTRVGASSTASAQESASTTANAAVTIADPASGRTASPGRAGRDRAAQGPPARLAPAPSFRTRPRREHLASRGSRRWVERSAPPVQTNFDFIRRAKEQSARPSFVGILRGGERACQGRSSVWRSEPALTRLEEVRLALRR